MFRKKEKYVRISSPADEGIDILVPAKIYYPVYKNMDEEQLPEFFYKFSNYTNDMDVDRAIHINSNLRIRALRGILDDCHNETNTFLADLNANTNCFGVIDWDKFLDEGTIVKIVEKTKAEYLTKFPEFVNM